MTADFRPARAPPPARPVVGRLAPNLALRLLHAGGLVAAVVVFNFLLIHLAPGDPALAIAGGMGGATEETLADIRRDYGLDQPFLHQLAAYARRVASGDLGHSIHFDAPVADLVLARLGPTLLLAATALPLAAGAGAVLGVHAARRPRGAFGNVVTVLALAAWSAPAFWTGILLLFAFSAGLPLFPLSGMADLRADSGGLARALDVAHHVALPAVTLALVLFAPFYRIARAGTIDALGADYIRTARAKGLAEPVILFRHALPNAALPLVTLAGVQFGTLLSGSVLVETVFDWPGLGRLAFESVVRRDHPTLLGVLLVGAGMIAAANLLADLACRVLDPRIRTRPPAWRNPP